MKTRFHIGVDASKGKACFHIQSQDLSVVRKDSFDADCDGMGRLLKRLRSLGAEPSASVVAIEATGLHHVNWCELLACAGYAVYALNPLISKRCYSPGNAIRDAKSDPLDAEGLCRIAGSPELSSLERFRYRSSAASFALKRLLCVYKAQRKALTSLLLSAGDLLDFAFPELRSIRLTLVHKGLVRLLLEHPGAESISRLSIGELQGYVGSKAGQLLKAARSSSCPPELARGSGEALRCALASIQQLRSSLEATQSSVESALRACVDARRERLARSILGFGRKTTAEPTSKKWTGVSLTA